MLLNYLRVAVRALRRSPGYTAINVASLSLGLASCVLMLLFVAQEWTYDAFHENADSIYRLYRVEERLKTPRKQSGGTMAPLGPAIAREVPGVEAVSRLVGGSLDVLRTSGETVSLYVAYVDPDFLEMFDFGTSAEGLASPGTVLLTHSAVERLAVDAGSDIVVDRNGTDTRLLIEAIIPDVPTNSSIQFDALARFDTWPNYDQASATWDSFGNSTLVQMGGAGTANDLETALIGIVRANYGETIDQMIARGWWADREDTFRIKAQPLREAHLSPEIDAFYLEVSNPTYSYILLAIAIVVLLIACTNFMTLAVGRSVTRAREVGTRKALGASRRQVASQFWGEALLLSFVAAGIGLMLADLFLPVFNGLADKALVLEYSVLNLAAITGLATAVGLLAGAYPAAILSGLRPSAVLSRGASGRRGGRFTSVVIVCQFAAAVALISTAAIMYRQLQFMAHHDLGFAAEEVVVVPLQARGHEPAELYDQFSALLAASPAVVDFSPSSSAFGGSWSRTVVAENDVNHIVYTNLISPSFLRTMGMELMEGRNLSDDFETDAQEAILVNEAFVRALGWENPLGSSLSRWPDTRVVGVVRDFHNLSLHQTVQPVILHMSPEISTPGYAMVRVRTEQTERALADIATAWGSVAPGTPLQAQFLDERLQNLYETEQRWQEIAGFAALFAIIISCLGLFGVATMSVSRRRKEIGVRKVFGASSGSLALLVSREFVGLIGAAILVGSGLAYLFADQWLEGFAYRLSVSPLLLLGSGAAALAIALLTVSYQAFSAAGADPTKTLRYE